MKKTIKSKKGSALSKKGLSKAVGGVGGMARPGEHGGIANRPQGEGVYITKNPKTGVVYEHVGGMKVPLKGL